MAFLTLQGLGVLVWAGVLLLYPPAQDYFLAPGAPGPTLLAFMPGDLLFWVAGSLASAWGLAHARSWAWPLLCAVTGAVVYAGLYGLALALFSGGGGWLGGAFMLPSIVAHLWMVWVLRPRGVA